VKKWAILYKKLEMWNQRWQPRNGFDSRLMAIFKILTIQVNWRVLLQVSGTKFTWIVVIKFAISLPSQPFLGCHAPLISLLFHPGFLGYTLFSQLCSFCKDITSFLQLHNASILAFGQLGYIFFLPAFFFTTGQCWKHLMCQEEPLTHR